MASPLRMASFNSKGLGVGKIEYLNELARQYHFIFLQKHWLFNKQVEQLEKEIPSMSVHGVSGMEDDEILIGRPYGGCAILWDKSLLCKVSPVNTSSKRDYVQLKSVMKITRLCFLVFICHVTTPITLHRIMIYFR